MQQIIIGVLIEIAVLAIFALFFRRYIARQMERSITRYQSDLMEKHCEEVENMYRQTRGWRHDYHNHIQTMKAHLTMGEYEELERYLNELDTDLTTVDTVIKTGNVMIDAILNSKISLAKNRSIRVEAKSIVPANLNTVISEVDLSLIIGNLMDNAMEACMKIEDEEQRFIRVYIDIMKSNLYVYVMNSVQGELKRAGKRYESTKSGKYHGFGLVRMDRVVEKYKGYLNRQNEEGVFATEILLPLASK